MENEVVALCVWCDRKEKRKREDKGGANVRVNISRRQVDPLTV